MTSYFDRVAHSLANLPRTELTREIIDAWKFGISLRASCDDIHVLLENVLSKTHYEDLHDLFTDSIMYATCFIMSDIQKRKQISQILVLVEAFERD